MILAFQELTSQQRLAKNTAPAIRGLIEDYINMKYRLAATGMAITLMAGCSMLTDLAMDAISPDKGGINTELVLGDKEQTLGTNQEVKAKNIGRVIGTSDNSIVAASAKEVKVTNNTFPV